MSALDQIRARLEAATEYHPAPHRAVVNTAGDRHGVVDASGSVVTMDPPGAAHFYANAPTDVAWLLAELRKRDEALERVERLAIGWHLRGESDMAFSKTLPDEDIAVAILTDGAAKVENARHIRNALKGDA